MKTGKKRMFIPCGACNWCLVSRRTDWSFRLFQEYKGSTSAAFITLTYDNTYLPTVDLDGVVHPGGVVVKRDLQLFMKRVRKFDGSDKIRFYGVGEYGSKTQRPHYHVLLFNHHQKVLDNLHKLWPFGKVDIGDVNVKSIWYTVKFHVNPLRADGRPDSFALMSRRPGIGHRYLQTHTKWHRDDMRFYTKVGDVEGRLPRYYREKIFTAGEREHHAQVAIEESRQRFLDELKRLEPLHSDPFNYYVERDRCNYEAVQHKSNLNDKL